MRLDLEQRGVSARVEVVEDRTASGGLLKAIEEHKPQLIVLGSSTRGKVGHVLLGGTAEKVIHDASCPVAIVPHGYRRPEQGVRMIGAAFTPTQEGREAFEAAAMVARRGKVGLRAITVLEGNMEQHGGLMAEQHHDADPRERTATTKRMETEAALRAAIAEFAADLDVDVDVLAQDPAEALIAASRHVDMLVMGSRGARGEEVGRARQRLPPRRGRRRLPGPDPPARRERDGPAARLQRPGARTRVTAAAAPLGRGRARRRRPCGAPRAPALGPRRVERGAGP